MLTREEIQAIYDRGPEAVIALVEELLVHIAEQQQMLAALADRVRALEEQLAKDSHNSSKPPSSDGLRKRARSLRRPTGRKPGGQRGHPGSTLQWVETPDRVVEHSPRHCRRCGTLLERVAASHYERRQVWELPPLKLEVVEHRVEVKWCPGCGEENQGAFPAELTQPVQYGPGVKAWVVYLREYQLLPLERTRELMEDLLGTGLSEATVYGAVQECHQKLEETEEAIKARLQKAPVAHFDETGMSVDGKRVWLHVASSEQLTHYGWHEKRGKAATDEIGILPKFGGTGVHDGLSFYHQYPWQHGLCNAHHLRELTFIEEEHQQEWAGKMKALLVEMKGEVEGAREAGLERLEEGKQQELEGRYQKLLEEGLKANPSPDPEAGLPLERKKRGRKKQSKAKNLLDRLSKYRREVLAFMYDFRVPFDNNLAERDLRMMKVQQKISGCFRTEEGARCFCRIRGYISTMRKQGKKLLTGLEGVFIGQPFIPVSEAE